MTNAVEDQLLMKCAVQAASSHSPRQGYACEKCHGCLVVWDGTFRDIPRYRCLFQKRIGGNAEFVMIFSSTSL